MDINNLRLRDLGISAPLMFLNMLGKKFYLDFYAGFCRIKEPNTLDCSKLHYTDFADEVAFNNLLLEQVDDKWSSGDIYLMCGSLNPTAVTKFTPPFSFKEVLDYVTANRAKAFTKYTPNNFKETYEEESVDIDQLIESKLGKFKAREINHLHSLINDKKVLTFLYEFDSGLTIAVQATEISEDYWYVEAFEPVKEVLPVTFYKRKQCISQSHREEENALKEYLKTYD